MQETQELWVRSLGWKDPLERKWQPTPVFLPGKFQRYRRLLGYSPWGHKSQAWLSSLSLAKHPDDYRWIETPTQTEFSRRHYKTCIYLAGWEEEGRLQGDEWGWTGSYLLDLGFELQVFPWLQTLESFLTLSEILPMTNQKQDYL